jgi:ankyrin repeat protein
LANGASVNDYAFSGNFETPLHLAAMAPIPRPSLVEFLIKRGAQINSTTSDGKTPLHLAAERGREQLFRTLLDAGADLSIEVPNDQKSTTNAEKGDKKDTPITAFELAKKNPFGSLWFDDDGQLRPIPKRSGRDSAATIFEDMDSDISDPETGGSSTLVGSEPQYIAV